MKTGRSAAGDSGVMVTSLQSPVWSAKTPMHIEKIKYFLDLYDCGSYTETARRNYISQTAVSQFIHSLEQEFQVAVSCCYYRCRGSNSGLHLKQALLPSEVCGQPYIVNKFIVEQALSSLSVCPNSESKSLAIWWVYEWINERRNEWPLGPCEVLLWINNVRTETKEEEGLIR